MSWASDISNISLTPEDLKRFGHYIISDLQEFLPTYQFHINWSSANVENLSEDKSLTLETPLKEEEEGISQVLGDISLPIIYRGQFLAQINGKAKENDAPRALISVMPLILNQVLEKLLLYKTQAIDQETGLYSKNFFLRQLDRQLKQEVKALVNRRKQSLSLGEEKQAGVTVILAELKGFGKFSGEYGRLKAKEALLTLAEWLKDQHLGIQVTAKLSNNRLGLLCNKAQPSAIKSWGEKVMKATELHRKNSPHNPLPLLPALAWAQYPHDFEQSSAEELKYESLGKALLTKATLALMNSLNQPGFSIQAFSNLLKSGGQVVQILPEERAVINLGYAAGAKSGQIFLFSAADKENKLDYKGEVLILEAAENYSIAHVQNLKANTSISPGDLLSLSREISDESPADFNTEESQDLLLGIPNYQQFLKSFLQQLETEGKGVLALLRLDAFEQFRAAMGQQETNKRLKTTYQNLIDKLPQNALVGRFSAAILAIYLNDFTEEEALKWGQNIIESQNKATIPTISMGLVNYPKEPLKKEELTIYAQKALEHAAFLGPSKIVAFSALSLNLSGDRLFEADDLAGALIEYRLGLALQPDNINLLNSLAVCVAQLGNLKEAIESFKLILEKEAENFIVLYNLGYSLSLLSNLSEAKKYFLQASKIISDNFDCLFHLGKIQLELGEVPEALVSLLKASKLPTAKAIINRYLGQAYWQVNDENKAFAYFKQAVKADPDDASSLSILGQLFVHKGTDFDVAKSLLAKSVELDPTNSLYRHRYGRLLFEEGQIEAAENELRLSLNYGGKSPDIHYRLALICEKLGKTKEAKKLYEETLKIDPDYKQAQEALKNLTIL